MSELEQQPQERPPSRLWQRSTFPVIGTGEDGDPRRPDIPKDVTDWHLVRENDDGTFVVDHR